MADARRQPRRRRRPPRAAAGHFDGCGDEGGLLAERQRRYLISISPRDGLLRRQAVAMTLRARPRACFRA